MLRTSFPALLLAGLLAPAAAGAVSVTDFGHDGAPSESVSVSARAESSGRLRDVVARASSSAAGAAVVEARANAAAPALDLPRHSPQAALVFATAGPEPEDVAATLSGEPAVAHMLQDADILVIGRFRLEHPQARANDSIVLGAELELIDPSRIIFRNPQRRMRIGFLNAEVLGHGFYTLRFLMESEDGTLFDESFDDPADALAFFDDLVLETDELRWLRLVFELTAHRRSDGFEMGVVVGLTRVAITPVPEPSTGALVALGLLVLAGRRPPPRWRIGG